MGTIYCWGERGRLIFLFALSNFFFQFELLSWVIRVQSNWNPQRTIFWKVKQALLRGWTVGGKSLVEAATRAEWDANRQSCRKCGEMLFFISDGTNKQQALWCILGQLIFQMCPPGKSGHSPQMCLCGILFTKHRTRALCLQGAKSQTDGLWGYCYTCLSGQVKAGNIFFQRWSRISWVWFLH